MASTAAGALRGVPASLGERLQEVLLHDAVFIANSTGNVSSTTSNPEPEEDWGSWIVLPILLLVCFTVGRQVTKMICSLFWLFWFDFIFFMFASQLTDHFWWLAVATIFLVNGLTLTLELRWPQDTSDEWECRTSDSYTNLAVPLEKAWLCFAVQTMLMQFYLMTAIKRINSFGFDENTDSWKHAYFPASVLIQFYVYSHAAESFPADDWRKIWRSPRLVEVHSGSDVVARRISSLEVLVRLFMSFTVKMVYARLLVVTLPAVLMDSPTGLDFAKDAFAVTFISSLDAKEGQIMRFSAGSGSTVAELADMHVQGGVHGQAHAQPELPDASG